MKENESTEPMEPLMKPSEFLRKYPSRWTKGVYKSGSGCYCLEGLLSYGPDDVHHVILEESHAVYEAVKDMYPDRQIYGPGYGPFCIHLPGFNDHPATTIEDVIAVLERAGV